MNKVHFSSKSNEWTTPQNLYDKLDKEFNFTLDPCCTKESAKCDKFYTKEDDGLSKDWRYDRVFMNPPYGREISKWIEKAYKESLKGAIVVCLIPARTDTRYWHDYIFTKAEVRFLKGRVKFGRNGIHGPAPFPSAVVIFNCEW
jgi:site-specific DNA-methyltransferase (adenine-specific)